MSEAATAKPFIRVKDCYVGVMVKVDAGFACIPADERRLVHRDDDGGLYIECSCVRSHGHHYLAGQLSDDGKSFVGVYPVE